MKTAAIIVPVLAPKLTYLQKSLVSALNQTYPTEVVVVASDETPLAHLELINHFQDSNPALLLRKERRRGFAAAINTGIETTTAERVGLLLSDDWLRPAAVEACLGHDADIVSTNLEVFEETGSSVLPLGRRKTMAEFEGISQIEDRAAYLSHFFLFRRDALLSIGGVDETIGDVGPDDFDMIWTLLENDATVAIIDQALYCYRDHPYQRLTLRPIEKMISDFEKILDKHRVFGQRRQHMLAAHSLWFGRTMQEADRTLRERFPQG